MSSPRLLLVLVALTGPLATMGFHLPRSLPKVKSLSDIVTTTPPHLLHEQQDWRRRKRIPLSTTIVSSTSSTTSSNDMSSTETSISAHSSDVRSDWEEEHHDGDDHHDDESDLDDGEEDERDEEEDPLFLEFSQWEKAIQKAQKALEKKQTSLEHEWQKAQTVEDTVARAQLIVNNLYLFNERESIYTVVDWENDGVEVELKLNSKEYESPSAEADALFAQARKLKRGSKVVEELLEQVEQAQQLLEDCQMDLESALHDDGTVVEEGRLRLVQDRLRRTSSSTQFQEPREQQKQQQSAPSKTHQQQQQQRGRKPALGTPASNVRKLTTPAGATVLVGRNRRGNEYLTFTQARANDIWMHARGTPGAHVLVLDRRGSIHPTNQCLEFAAHLAAFYSDGRAESKVPVTLAEPKHLLKPRGAPLGAVKLRQEGQVLYGCPDLVPHELQEARAQSGLTEEYRSADKAKHRKHTQRVVQREKQKQRQQHQQQRKRRRHHYHDDDDDDGE